MILGSHDAREALRDPIDLRRSLRRVGERPSIASRLRRPTSISWCPGRVGRFWDLLPVEEFEQGSTEARADFMASLKRARLRTTIFTPDPVGRTLGARAVENDRFTSESVTRTHSCSSVPGDRLRSLDPLADSSGQSISRPPEKRPWPWARCWQRGGRKGDDRVEC